LWAENLRDSLRIALSFLPVSCSVSWIATVSPNSGGPMNLAHDLATLPMLSVAQLRSRYAETFGEPTRAAHKAWLIKRIAGRLQALAEGDLSERASQRATELANDADLRLSPPKPAIAATPENPAPSLAPQALALVPGQRDHRLPPPGGTITRLYK